MALTITNDPTSMACEACGQSFPTNKTVVGCVPGVPYSACYCHECVQKNSHPMWVLISNTASMGGLHNAHESWRAMVADSLVAQGKSPEWFAQEVEKAIAALDNYDPTPAPPSSDEF
jgi:predicted amidophosphoribosyltransferase